MKLYPTLTKTFELNQSQESSLEKLTRRTDITNNLTSQKTEKSFRGMINGNKFKIISAAIGKGALCVLNGEINSKTGVVEVEIHKVFKVFATIFYLTPLIGAIGFIFNEKSLISIPLSIVIAALQFLVIRFVFIGIPFKFLSRESLNRLRDVLDIDWTNGN